MLLARDLKEAIEYYVPPEFNLWKKLDLFWLGSCSYQIICIF